MSVQSVYAGWAVLIKYDSFNQSELLPILLKSSSPYEGTKNTHFSHKHATPVTHSLTIPQTLQGCPDLSNAESKVHNAISNDIPSGRI